jgi:paraquat-inducible protein A
MTLIACLDCDLLQRERAEAGTGVSRCCRCGAVIHRAQRHSMGHALALALACAQLWILANFLPLVTMEIRGDHLTASLPRAAWALYEHDMPELAALVFVTTTLAPALELAAMIYLLLGLRVGIPQSRFALAFRWVQRLRAWGMIDVLMLGILVALVKLSSLARVAPGLGLWSFAALLVLMAALNITFNPREVWRWFDERQPCTP